MIQIFRNEEFALRLMSAVTGEINEGWSIGEHYFDMQALEVEGKHMKTV